MSVRVDFTITCPDCKAEYTAALEVDSLAHSLSKPLLEEVITRVNRTVCTECNKLIGS